jgi:NADH dehydrogenase [ubiquinone] 1 alpha subcomplex assembly factor 7
MSYPLGSVFEYPALGLTMMEYICQRLVDQGGQALIIDYGPDIFGVGDTLQAVYQGKTLDVFSHIGQADLSCHVPFGVLTSYIHQHYPDLSCTVTAQGRFLHDLGILTRLAALMRQNPHQAQALGAAYHRLTHPTQMGSLFKVLRIAARR